MAKERRLRGQGQVNVRRDLETGEFVEVPLTAMEDVLTEQGSLNSRTVRNLDAFYDCNHSMLNADVGGQCLNCNGISCMVCHGQCAKCLTPLCLSCSSFIAVEDHRVRVCRRCKGQLSRKRFIRRLFSPFLSRG